MSPQKQKSVTVPIRIGIDTGGTFTDFVAARGSRFSTFKVPSTPHNPAEAILTGIGRILSDSETQSFEIVHGTTVATNAILERKGARTALITTKGFEDVIEIGRQARPDLYNLMVTRPSPLVPRELRFGLEERTGPTGEIITPLAQDSIARLVKLISNHNPDVESAAVCLLFSFANPAHEEAIASALEPLGIPVSQSHKILPEYREYERTSTVVINAYLVPLMSRYLSSLGQGLDTLANRQRSKINSTKELRQDNPKTLRVMQSNGGSVSASTASAEPVRAILSGPAGGVVGALRVCSVAGINDIITFDMGGTSTDVALCRGEARTTNEAVVAGLPVAVPVIDIHTVGAGGGSIARVDAAGALRVGPESAGADPGPACYGRGMEVTVTDANLVLGRFGGASLLGGEMHIDLNRARSVLSRLADEISRFTRKRTTAQQAALGVIRVANANMEAALRVVSIERGQDPRLFTLVSFGGAGGLHVCDLAASLRIPRIVVPKSPGTLSALGVLLGDVVKDYSRTVMMKAGQLEVTALERSFAELEQKAMRDLKAEGFDKERLKLKRSVALRYAGQSFEIDIPWSKNFGSNFHASHRERYGYADSSRPIEVVSLRVRAAGITQKPAIVRERRTGTRRLGASLAASQVTRAYLNERQTEVPVYARENLKAGMKFKGPAIVTEYSSTTLITANFRASVDPWLNLIVEAI